MNPPPLQPPGHRMILASAGSGKTYALTNRFVQLLALGAAPERIVALTFTRKAAGEFSDEILKKLARAAADPDYASTLARELFPDDAQRRLFKAQHSAFSVQRSTSASAPPSPPLLFRRRRSLSAFSLPAACHGGKHTPPLARHARQFFR
ncbi:ATP-dependent exonuclase V beta subunit, helicase and exonuclease domain-containing [Opitutaceae bacterium TAV1]|nr:ATP-dependent exonuclase V beta subunit, helicase and exonuclease domain-containing [Opitutaceae bacterium TAV1]